MFIALGLTAVTALLLLGFIVLRRRSPAVLRPIEAFDQLKRVIGLAVENGTRLHISLGRGNLFTSRGGSALTALAMLRQLAERTAIGDRPPIVTSGDAPLALLSQDTLQAGYQAAGADDQYRANTGRLTGLTPFSYAAGTIPVTRDENVSATVVLGDLGIEAALLAESADREDTHLIAASDNLTAQSILFASAQHPLIGEELFAAPAYVGAEPAHQASLQVQDILRWLVILAILGGTVLRMLRII